MKDISKHYDRLTPQERITLTIEARARGDIQEFEAIAGTCPKVLYRMNEPAYAEKMELLQTLSFIHAARFFRERGSAFAARVLFVLAPTDENAKFYALRVSELLAHREAWARFCDEIGQDPGKVMEALAFPLDGLTDCWDRPDIKPNVELTEWLYLDYLNEWERV